MGRAKGFEVPQETRDNLSKALKGRKKSPEHIAKIAAAHAKRNALIKQLEAENESKPA